MCAPGETFVAGLCSLLVVASLFAGVGLVGVGTVAAAPQQIDSCTTITESGTYELTADVTTEQAVGDSCIDIEAGGVVFDGGGHTIQSNGTGTGVAVGECCSAGPDDVVVHEVTVSNFADGISSYEASNVRIRNVTVRSSQYFSSTDGGAMKGGGDGIYLWQGTDLEVTDSTVLDSDESGIQVSGVDVVIQNNRIVGSDHMGLNAHGANHLISGNVFEDNAGFGSLFAYGFGDHTVRDNTVLNGEGRGITVGADSEVVDNVVRDNEFGIEVGQDGVVTGNRIVGNEKGGILLDDAGNLIYDNYLENERNVVGPEGGSPTVGATWNVERRSGENVVGGSVVGGNFWAAPDGDGYSETCTDADDDGICDEAYAVPGLSQTDDLPLADSDDEDPKTTTTTTEETTTSTTETTTTEETTTSTTETTTTETTTIETTETTETTTAGTTRTTTTTESATTEEATTTETTTTTTSTTTESSSGGTGATGGTGGSTGGGQTGGETTEKTTSTTATQTPATKTTQTTATMKTTQTTATKTTQTTAATEMTNETELTDETRTATETDASTDATDARIDAKTVEPATVDGAGETRAATAAPTSAATTVSQTTLVTSAAIPGFQFLVAMLALVAGGVLATRRR